MNNQTLLLRQVHPRFIVDDEISSQAFYPFPKDHGNLSAYDGDQISPEAAYQHYTDQLGLISVGAWAVSGHEIESASLMYKSDPVAGNPAHAVICFAERTDKECRRLAKILKRSAIERGCLFQQP